jgi:hypothetical protein
MIEGAIAAHTENEQALIGSLSPAERVTMADLLRTFLAGFEDEDHLLSPIDSLHPGDGARPTRRSTLRRS